MFRALLTAQLGLERRGEHEALRCLQGHYPFGKSARPAFSSKGAIEIVGSGCSLTMSQRGPNNRQLIGAGEHKGLLPFPASGGPAGALTIQE